MIIPFRAKIFSIRGKKSSLYNQLNPKGVEKSCNPFNKTVDKKDIKLHHFKICIFIFWDGKMSSVK